MKKDIFNGKIKKEHLGYAKAQLIATPIITAIIGIALSILTFIFQDKMGIDAAIFLYVICGIALVYAITYPIIFLFIIRNAPKYDKIADKFIGGYDVLINKNNNEDSN